MARCRLAGGHNCRVGLTSQSGVLAVVRAPDGSLFADFAKSGGQAKDSALAQCKTAGMSCETILVSDNKSWR
jgi:hypothetical protein